MNLFNHSRSVLQCSHSMSKTKQFMETPPQPTPQIHKQQLHRILSLCVPLGLKIKLIEGILDTIKHMIFTQTHSPVDQFTPDQQQQVLWEQIQHLERDIIQKRKEKENNENNLDLYFDEIEDIQEVLDMKVEILERVNEEIEAKRTFKEGMTSTIAQSMVSDNIDNI